MMVCVDLAIDAPAAPGTAVDAPAVNIPVSDAVSDTFFDVGKTICSTGHSISNYRKSRYFFQLWSVTWSVVI